jgi:hypothetical protein
MALYQYQYKKASLFSDNFEITDSAGNPQFFISAHRILDAHYEIRYVSSDVTLWECKEAGTFSSGLRKIEKPERNVNYKIASKGIFSRKFTTSFAGVKLSWKLKSFLKERFVAIAPDDDKNVVEMADSSIWHEKGVININLSVFYKKKAIHRKLMDPLNDVHQGWDSEYIKLDLMAFLLLTTYSLYRHLKRRNNEKDGGGDSKDEGRDD